MTEPLSDTILRDAADYANKTLGTEPSPDDVARVIAAHSDPDIVRMPWDDIALGYVAGRQSVRDLVASVDPACRCEPDTGCPWSKLREMLGYDP